MPKELATARPNAGTFSSSASASYAPYPKDTNARLSSAPPSAAASALARSGAVVIAGASGSNNNSSKAGGGPPRLTINNFPSFRARVKKLPPDANTKAALHTQLYQFPDRVCFGCVKCRRDNVQSDSVAIDLKNRIMLCTACFTRIIRPRTYKPSRVVPFPSLLSWLNYKPSTVVEVSEDVLERPAEAVAPSGERMAAPMLSGGDRATNLGKLPAIAMSIAAGRGGGNGGRRVGVPNASTMDDAVAQSTAGVRETHPCLRVWGVCQHGETCLFRNAPSDLCIAYLMGLCKGHGSPIASTNLGGSAVGAAPGRGRGMGGGGGGRGGRGGFHGSNNRGRHRNTNFNNSRGGHHRGGNSNIGLFRGGFHAPNQGMSAGQTCRLLHQEVYDLPNTADPCPVQRFEGDLEDEEGEWAAWVRRRRESPNSAEWQLWHNGPLESLFRVYVPAQRRPLPPRLPESADEGGDEEVKAEGEEEEEEEEEGEEVLDGAVGEGENGEGDDGSEAEVADGKGLENDEASPQNVEADDDDEEGEEVPPPPEPTMTKLSLLDIMAALKGMKKDAAPSAPSGNEEEDGSAN